MSEVFQQTLAGKRRRTNDKCEVEAGCGKEGVSGKNVENDEEKSLWVKVHKVVVRDLWRKVRLAATETGFWSYKQGKVLGRPKVFKAHAVPQGLCANLINALELLANQQEDGDGLQQNIATNLGKGEQKTSHGRPAGLEGG